MHRTSRDESSRVEKGGDGECGAVDALASLVAGR